MSHQHQPWTSRKLLLASLLSTPLLPLPNQSYSHNNAYADEESHSRALDRLLHGHNVIGWHTKKSKQIEELRFTDRDFEELGTLDAGQFGVIHVVRVRSPPLPLQSASQSGSEKLYVRKTTAKSTILRNANQLSFQLERDILLLSTRTQCVWTPHLLCAFHSADYAFLSVIMGYEEGGTIGDVLESASEGGRIGESDVRWWAPQVVEAVCWLHGVGFVHRDIKPTNFVLTQSNTLKLIDFGSAAPLLPSSSTSSSDGGPRLIPTKYCIVPCGTCDYISPEILRAHEDALLALALSPSSPLASPASSSSFHDSYASSASPSSSSSSTYDKRDKRDKRDTKDVEENIEPYGAETDWWSTGAMFYEMIYGVTPFFANDIQRTYMKIMDHENTLTFPPEIPISSQLRDLISSLLCENTSRLGRLGSSQLKAHPFFDGVRWDALHIQQPPPDLHTPHFIYPGDTAPNPNNPEAGGGLDTVPEITQEYSRAFAFSALFQSTISGGSPGIDVTAPNPNPNASAQPPQQERKQERDGNLGASLPSSLGYPSLSLSASTSSTSGNNESFIGFTWGPTLDAFSTPSRASLSPHTHPTTYAQVQSTPAPKPRPFHMQTQTPHSTPNPFLLPPTLNPHTTPRAPIPAAAYLYPGLGSGTPYAGGTPYRAGDKGGHVYMTPLRGGRRATATAAGAGAGAGTATPGGAGGGGFNFNPLVTPFRTLPRSTTRARARYGSNTPYNPNPASASDKYDHEHDYDYMGTAPRRRAFSDQEALEKLIECVGMSARKKVLGLGLGLESGRKASRVLRQGSGSGRLRSGSAGSAGSGGGDKAGKTDGERKEGKKKGKDLGTLDIQPYARSSQARRGGQAVVLSQFQSSSSLGASASASLSARHIPSHPHSRTYHSNDPDERDPTQPEPQPEPEHPEVEADASSSSSTHSPSLPPSPSPTPRPGSAMSILSHRGATSIGRSATPSGLMGGMTFDSLRLTGRSVSASGVGGSARIVKDGRKGGRERKTPSLSAVFALGRDGEGDGRGEGEVGESISAPAPRLSTPPDPSSHAQPRRLSSPVGASAFDTTQVILEKRHWDLMKSIVDLERRLGVLVLSSRE